MAYVPRGIRERWVRDAQYARELAAMKRHRNVEFVEVPFEWQTKQTRDSALFPSYGWVPHEMLRWRKLDGTVVPWSWGRQGDVFLMAADYASRSNPGL
ncbi:MAG: hypothetical protein CVV05_01405 [Gammaproteobacteria bacterium HGW-Gammaproteobacteria-1]|jgi:hypothetical protein|nr:MAG: hypothetical protein CVV05_01405 [Gammaproteobacteria bacterium HGW-Gammaproteobacteria-1]